MRTIIAGGRDYLFTRENIQFLDSIRDDVTEVVSGNATGADACGEAWANARGIQVKTFPADWKQHGPAAGPIRNKQMAEYAAGGQCILFPGGRGTANMKKNALLFGLKVIEAKP